MPRIPWWAVVSAGSAPVLLIGGWTVAARLQPSGFDPVADSISALAAYGAADRWVMTAALAGLGACHVITALGLRPAPMRSRLVLGLGGGATVLVACFPLPRSGGSAAHGLAAGVAFVALALWPAGAARRDAGAPWPLRRRVAWPAAAVLTGLVGWFAIELATGSRTGLAERVAAGAQAVWPLVAVCTTRVGRRPTD